MYELPDAIIIIPVRIDQPQRLVNLQRNLAFLKAHLSVEIKVIEQDSESKCPADVFVRDGDTFHKTRLFNQAVRESTKTVCFFLDVDVLVDPDSYRTAYERLSTGACDVCLLYSRTNPACHYVEVPPHILDGVDPLQWMSVLRPLSDAPAKCEGGIVAFRREAFHSIGGFNERFVGYGHEDSEMLNRATRCELRYQELPYSIYHQSHTQSYMKNCIPFSHISMYIRDQTLKDPLAIVKRREYTANKRYVTISKSGGRLGNILFELAMLFHYAKITVRHPFLSIPAPYATFLAPLVARMRYPPSSRSITRITPVAGSDPTFFAEHPVDHDDAPIVQLSSGYFQCQIMLSHVKWMFQDCLGSKESPHPSNRVMLHVRRGDYAKYPTIYEQLGECYYTRAMAYVKQVIPDATFVVFSDERETVRQYSYLQHRPDVEFFDDSGMKDTDVLCEMTRYQSYILANSTFGLWGAMLSKHASTVVVPLHWSKTDSADCLGFWTPIYDPSWIRISNRPITILSDNPQFALFAPLPESPPSIALYSTHIPETRPTANVTAMITNHPESYVCIERPVAIDYLFSTTLKQVGVGHSSWANRPFVYIATPGSLEHFHLVQSVAETLIDSPRVSACLFHASETRPTCLIQTLHSVYQQTNRDWEVLLQLSYIETTAYFRMFKHYLAIPKLLPILPTSPSCGLAYRQVRTPIIAFIHDRSILSKSRFELQRRDLKQMAISRTDYVDESGTSRSGGRLADVQMIRGTTMVNANLISADGTIDPMIPTRTLHSSLIRFYRDPFEWTPSPTDTPLFVLPAMFERSVQHGESSLVSGMDATGVTAQLLQWRSRQQDVSQAKKSFGVKYLL